MFSLILLLGSAFIFANPDLGNYSATADYRYYAISDTIEGSKGIESRVINGAYGFGLGVHGTYLNRSLALRSTSTKASCRRMLGRFHSKPSTVL